MTEAIKTLDGQVTQPVDPSLAETHVPLPAAASQTVLEVAALQVSLPELGSGEHPTDFIPLPPMELSQGTFAFQLFPVDETLFDYSFPKNIDVIYD